MTLKNITLVWGLVFVVIGILGFVPGLTYNNHLLGLFLVDPIHNLIHILTGLIAFAVAFSYSYSKLYFQIFGIVYALVALLGLLLNGNLWIIHVNGWDNLLHFAIALVSLYLGFLYKDKYHPKS